VRKGDIVPRLFISHSSHDNLVALAFRQWLVINGWTESDVFIDLHDLRAGARWREELRKANTAAVLLLASPEALDSPEWQEELKLADILEKEIIPVIVRDLALDDPRLARYKNKEIQIVDLRAMPTERTPAVEFKGQVHELNFSTSALAAIKARLESEYLRAGRKLEKAGHRRACLFQASIFTLMSGVIALLLARQYDRELNGLVFKYMRVHPVSNATVLALPKGQPFWECAKTTADYSEHCPAMVVIPAGEFMMGSPETEKYRSDAEGPRHKVAFKAPFAVAMHDITFDQYDACVAAGGCEDGAGDLGMGRGRRPVINVTWHNAQEYAKWLSAMTGHTYRLLTEAEWEYAARAGTTAIYYWGDDIGTGNANCDDCGSQWDNQTAPVGSFKPNAFGLYDMTGNVWQWVEDCYVPNYDKAPNDGRAVTGEEGCSRVVRGGDWFFNHLALRAAYRHWVRLPGVLGFRVARTIFIP
jgi:formylglycine-generating enzyme required for sulfatase activity